MNILTPLRLPEAFKTEIPSVDEEHAHLIEILNACLTAYGGSGVIKFSTVLEDFIDDLEEHFRHEESLMVDAGYPQAQQHAEHHRHWLSEIRTMQDRCEKRGYAEQQDIVLFFHKVMEDISKADIKFVEYLWCEGKIDDFRQR